jgi:hypothetical protein
MAGLATLGAGLADFAVEAGLGLVAVLDTAAPVTGALLADPLATEVAVVSVGDWIDDGPAELQATRTSPATATTAVRAGCKCIR